MKRRQVLATAGTTAALVIAGCLGDDDDSTDDGTDDGDVDDTGTNDGRFDSPEAVVEAYYETETEDEVSELLHSESERRANPPGEGIEIEPRGDAEVVEENLDEGELAEFPLAVSEGGLEVIAGQNNAAVQIPVALIPDDPDEALELDVRWLAAEDDGGWRIVDDLEG